VVGYKSPMFRFDNEAEDPLIPNRKSGEIYFDKKNSIETSLALEKDNASNQVEYVKNLLKQIEEASQLIIKTHSE